MPHSPVKHDAEQIMKSTPVNSPMKASPVDTLKCHSSVSWSPTCRLDQQFVDQESQQQCGKLQVNYIRRGNSVVKYNCPVIFQASATLRSFNDFLQIWLTFNRPSCNDCKVKQLSTPFLEYNAMKPSPVHPLLGGNQLIGLIFYKNRIILVHTMKHNTWQQQKHGQHGRLDRLITLNELARWRSDMILYFNQLHISLHHVRPLPIS